MGHDPALAAFVASLTQPAPRANASPALRGVWHALRGEWESAHDAVQADMPECAWVHAALHRQEGDLPNANYWYQQAGQAVRRGPHRDEYLAIARALLARSDDG